MFDKDIDKLFGFPSTDLDGDGDQDLIDHLMLEDILDKEEKESSGLDDSDEDDGDGDDDDADFDEFSDDDL